MEAQRHRTRVPIHDHAHQLEEAIALSSVTPKASDLPVVNRSSSKIAKTLLSVSHEVNSLQPAANRDILTCVYDDEVHTSEVAIAYEYSVRSRCSCADIACGD
jgi:flagellar hook-basal body complex protein FliE